MTVTLGELVRNKWASLLAEGFALVVEDTSRVELESPEVHILAVHDPRGEVEVRTFRRGSAEHYGWSYTGMVGRADVGRLLEIALREMRADPAILRGDTEFYAAVATDKAASAHAWTEYYARRAPRPSRKPLP